MRPKVQGSIFAKLVVLISDLNPIKVEIQEPSESQVFIVITVFGRFQRLKLFFEEVKNFPNTQLIITCYSQMNQRCEDLIENLAKLANVPIRTRELKGTFSRAVGLETGIRMAPRNALIFTCDVDIIIEVKNIEIASKSRIH